MTLLEILPWLGAAVGLIILSAFLASSELALFGLRRVDREQLARSGRLVDQLVLQLLGQSKRVVISALIGNEALNMTIAAIAAGWFGEWMDADLGVIALAAVGVAAPATILLGEVLPRTLALRNPIGVARAAARPLVVFAIVLAPVRWLLQSLADLIALPLGGSGRPRLSGDLSEEEFRTLVDAGSAQGQVDARERRLIHKVFEFGDKNVGQIMAPRDKIFALSYDLPMARLAREVAARGFSRVPIYQKSLDNVRGILNAKDLVLATSGQAPRILAELLHEPLFVPRTTPLARLFRTFKQKKVHVAMVVSEYGKLLGLITMEDLLEQLFGEIRDERDALQSGMRRGRGGRTPLPNSVPAVAAAEPAVAPVPDAMPPPPEGDGDGEGEAPSAAAAAARAAADAEPAAPEAPVDDAIDRDPSELTPVDIDDDAVPIAVPPRSEITKPFSKEDLAESLDEDRAHRSDRR